MMSERIYLASPHMGGSERRYVDLAFDTNWIAPLGANVTGFEQDLLPEPDVCGLGKPDRL